MTNDDKQSFGTLLREARNKAGKTLREVGAVAGRSLQYVSDWETGHRAPPDNDTLNLVASFLGADLHALVMARARHLGYVEVPLTGDERADRRAAALAVAALTKGA